MAKRYELRTADGMISPFWFNRGGHCRGKVVGPDGTIDADGVKLVFKDESLPPGTAVETGLDRQFYCSTVAELQAERDAVERKRAERKERERQERNHERDAAQAFNAGIQLPVKWDVGIKDVLSGLSSSAWGDGRNKATVEHILLLEPLEAGRLHRQAGDFLCTAISGTNGKNWSGTKIEYFIDGDGNRYQPQPTCKTCLRLLERFHAK